MCEMSSGLTVSVSVKIRDGTITEINSLLFGVFTAVELIIIPWPKLLKVVICLNHQIKSFVLKIKSIMIQSWFKSNHDLDLPITDVVVL